MLIRLVLLSLLLLAAPSVAEIIRCTDDDAGGTTCPVTCAAGGNYLVVFEHPPSQEAGALKVCATSSYEHFRAALEANGLPLVAEFVWEGLSDAQKSVCWALLNEGAIRTFQERVDAANREIALHATASATESVRPINHE